MDGSFGALCRKNYEKHLKDAREWVLPEKQEEFAGQRLKRHL